MVRRTLMVCIKSDSDGVDDLIPTRKADVLDILERYASTLYLGHVLPTLSGWLSSNESERTGSYIRRMSTRSSGHCSMGRREEEAFPRIQ